MINTVTSSVLLLHLPVTVFSPSSSHDLTKVAPVASTGPPSTDHCVMLSYPAGSVVAVKVTFSPTAWTSGSAVTVTVTSGGLMKMLLTTSQQDWSWSREKLPLLSPPTSTRYSALGFSSVGHTLVQGTADAKSPSATTSHPCSLPPHATTRHIMNSSVAALQGVNAASISAKA